MSGEDDVWETLACAEAAALVSAGETAATGSAAMTPFEEELLDRWESDCLLSGSFFDEDPADDVDGAEDGEAAVIAESWVPVALAAAFAVACAPASAVVDAAKLFSAVDIVFKLVVAGVAETPLEFPCAGTGAGTAKASGGAL